jgi:hypothetical protein
MWVWSSRSALPLSASDNGTRRRRRWWCGLTTTTATGALRPGPEMLVSLLDGARATFRRRSAPSRSDTRTAPSWPANTHAYAKVTSRRSTSSSTAFNARSPERGHRATKVRHHLSLCRMSIQLRRDPSPSAIRARIASEPCGAGLWDAVGRQQRRDCKEHLARLPKNRDAPHLRPSLERSPVVRRRWKRNRKVTPADVERGKDYLLQPLDLAPAVRVVLALGRPAQASVVGAREVLASRGVLVIDAPHPSPRSAAITRGRSLDKFNAAIFKAYEEVTE